MCCETLFTLIRIIGTYTAFPEIYTINTPSTVNAVSQIKSNGKRN
ncbi:hypothetical protein ABIB39_002872 [Mucilaginibacter sp. UYP27]